MGFFKKLAKGLGKVTKGVSKAVSKVTGAVSKVTGFAGKILPGPLGSLAKTASKVTGAASNVTGFASKLVGGLVDSKKKGKGVASPKLQAEVLSQGTSGGGSSAGSGLTIDLDDKSWFQKNMAWVIPSLLTVVGFFIWLFTKNKK
jgi:hypothetical protein